MLRSLQRRLLCGARMRQSSSIARCIPTNHKHHWGVIIYDHHCHHHAAAALHLLQVYWHVLHTDRCRQPTTTIHHRQPPATTCGEKSAAALLYQRRQTSHRQSYTYMGRRRRRRHNCSDECFGTHVAHTHTQMPDKVMATSTHEFLLHAACCADLYPSEMTVD